MAHLDDSLLLELLTTTLPDFIIEKWARQLEVVERERKVDIVLLVWSLILGFPAGARRTLTSLQRRFEQMLGETLSDSSFYDRLTPAFAELMERLVEWCLNQKIEQLHSEIAQSFEGFQELLAVDSTVLNLYDLLAGQWEGTNDDQAAAKLHVVADVIDSAARSVQLTDATTHDQTPWKTIGSWVEDSLLLMDLGYYDFHLFHRIDQQGGYFISRVKSNANPTIVRSNQTLRGRSIDLKGHKLQDVLGRLQRETIDVTVALEVELRKYRGTCSTITRHVRMVGVRNEETGEYHLYFTNVSGQQLTPRQVADTYRLRWQIELLFSALKSQMRLHQLPSSKDHVVRALIWASVLACLISNCLLQVMRRMRPDRVFPPQRMHAVFRDFAETILLKLARARRDRHIGLFELMLHEAADPNRSRERSHDVLDDIPLAERPSPPPYREAKR